ncbi:MAG: hypothetical protein NVS9B7_26490 [Flavisolibacter sp.]
MQKAISKDFSFRLALTGNLSRYRPDKKLALVNNFLEIAPALLYGTPNLSIQAGIRPSWDNSFFRLFPNILAEINSTDKRFAFQLGWTGYLTYSGFQYEAGFNPWVWAPEAVYNTRVEERYAGFKGSAGEHFTYGAKIGYNIFNNHPLYINDSSSGKSFMVLNEPQLKVVNFSGEVGYTSGEKFSLISNLTLNQYKAQLNSKAWGLLPIEFKTDMRVLVLKDLYATSNFYAFSGPWSYTKNGNKKLSGSMDFNAGLEFKIVSNVKIWGQFNNIFNNQYQRWNQYPVYGFNLLGGVVFSFAQKN